MKKVVFTILSGLIGFSINANEISITAFITPPAERQSFIKLRTPQEDIFVDLYKLDTKTRDLIKKSNSNTKVTLNIPSKAITKRKNVPFGIRPDCSEMPTNMEELDDIASKSENMLDFLKKIPEGSLQSFTFITNSLSLHRGQKDKNGEGQVSAMWPRVLRSSVDGRITISFVCDPKNPTFGKVEIIHFDDKEKEFKTTEYDFGHPSKEKVAPKDRIHKNPTKCISCHAGSEFNGKVSLKPNWPQYFQWSDCQEDRGIQMYGGNDDNMGKGQYREASGSNFKCNFREHEKGNLKEQENYLKFREMQKGNECFNSLPWPKDAPDRSDPEEKEFEKKWSYKYYPYSFSSAELMPDERKAERYFNYALRTNLRFTDTYAHLMAQRNANLLKKSPDYDLIKYLLVMEKAKCQISQDDLKEVSDLMPGVSLNVSSVPTFDDWTARETLLFDFAKHAGLEAKDWTMEFQEKNRPNYATGISNSRSSNFTRDLTINEVVGGEILKDISKENQKVANASKGKISRGIAEFFTSSFSCIDDLGGAIRNLDYYSTDSEALCIVLKKEHDKNLARIKKDRENCINCPRVEPPRSEKKMAEKIENVVKRFTAEQIANGKKLVEENSRGKCVMCHSASVNMLPKDFRFIPSKNDAKKNESVAVLQTRRSEMAEKLKRRLIEDKTMPPPPLGDELAEKDREDINAYILDLANGAR